MVDCAGAVAGLNRTGGSALQLAAPANPLARLSGPSELPLYQHWLQIDFAAEVVNVRVWLGKAPGQRGQIKQSNPLLR
eukprot:gene16962-22849_t